jgi:hypothetical protein
LELELVGRDVRCLVQSLEAGFTRSKLKALLAAAPLLERLAQSI